MTDYLKLAQESPAPQPTGANPYEALVAEDKKAEQARARAVIEIALKDDPEVAAERQRLAKTAGLPLRVVERNLDAVRIKEQARAIDLVKMAQDSPVLARQLTDPAFTTTAIDDLDTLTQIERSVGKAVSYMMGADGKGGLPSDVVGGAKSLGLGATVGVGKMAFDVAAVINDLIGWDAGATGARESAKRAQGAIDEYGFQAESSTGQGVKSGLQSAGTNLALLPLGLARGLYATASQAATTVAGLMAAGVGADAFNKAREQGKSELGAAVFGIPQAAFEFVFERIPAAKLFGDIAANTGLLKTLRTQALSEGWTEQITTLAQDFNEWMNLNPSKTLGEFLLERPDAAYQTFIATLVGVGVQTTTLKGIDKVIQKVTDQKLQFDLDAFEEQLKLAGQSMLRERSPEQFRAHVQSIVDSNDAATKSIHVDATVLNQLPEDVLNQLPESVRAQIPDALTANSSVEISMADVLTVAPGTPLEQVLNDNARMTPNGLSRADQQAASAKAQEFLQQEAERVIQQATDQEAFRASSEVVKASILGELNTTGRYRPAVSEGMATWATAFYTTMAGRVGMTPEQFYQQHRLRILGAPSTPGQQVMDQPKLGEISVEGYHYSKAARPAISTASFGTGLAGSSKDEYLNAADKRLRRRAYFYVDKGTGINPEAGVGGIGHRANLANVYDGDTDPLRLKTGRGKLDFESAVLDAGFSGYLTRMPGTQSGQVIMLGDQTIQTQVLGSLAKTTGKVVPPQGERPSRGRDQVGDRLRANKTLPAGELTFARWSEILAKQMPLEHEAMQAAGVFDAEGKVYKDGLLRRFEELTPAESYAQASRVRAVPASVAAAADIGSARGVATSRKWAKNRDFKMALQGMVRAAAGKINLRTDAPETRAYIIRQLVKEAREALVTNANAVGWYDDKVTTALEVVSAIHPELKTDEQARFAFIWALAVTSNGVKVDKNFEIAERAYRQWKDSNTDPALRRMPTSGIGVGPTTSKIHGGLAVYNDLMTRWGYERTRSFATTMQPNRIVKALYGRGVSGEGMDTQVFGAGVLGPKIGNGFFMNLFGEFGQLTMDRWWVRMWGRLTGDLVEVDPAGTRESRDKFVGVIDLIRADKEAVRALEKALGAKLVKGDPLAMAKVIMKATNEKDVRDALALVLPATPEREAAVTAIRGKLKDFVSVGDELRKAAKGYYGKLDGQIEVPGGSRRRDMMRAVSEAVLAELQQDNPNLTMADFQALMWYPEKTLYDSAGATEESEDGYDDDEAPDYANAAAALAREQGIPDAEINAAIERARSDIAARQRSGRSGRGSGELPAQDSPGAGDATLKQSAAGGRATLADFSREGLAGLLNKDGWAVLTAEDPGAQKASPEDNAAAMTALEGDLAALGAEWRVVIGKYGDTQKSLIVSGITEQQAFDLGAKYGQESILTREGLVYMRDGSVTPATGMDVFTDPPADFYTTIPGTDTYFSVRLDWGGEAEATETSFKQTVYRGVGEGSATGASNDGNLGAGYYTTESAQAAAEFAARRGGDKVMSGTLNATRVLDLDNLTPENIAALAGAIPRTADGLAPFGWPASLAADKTTSENTTADLEKIHRDLERGRFNPRALSYAVGQVDVSVLQGIYNAAGFDAVARTGDALRSGTKYREIVTFSPDAQTLAQQAQTPRGTFNPRTLELVLNPNANLSTFFHETGHFFLEVMADIASQPNAPAQIVEDMNTFLKWAGTDRAQWDKWQAEYAATNKIPAGLTRIHERWAESIEQYVMEGKAPSVELAPLMRRFAVWLKSVYGSIQAFIASKPEEGMALNDDIRRVMDRMLATDEQIAQANEVAGLMPNEEADGAAAERLNKRSMADLKWAVKARDAVIAKLRKQAKAIEKETRAAVTAEVNAMPEVLAKEAIEKAEKEHENDPFSADMNVAAIADAFNFESVEAMYRAIEMFGDKAEVIDGMTEQRMLEEHGDLIDERAIAEAANEAVHNEARARSLASELRTQGEMLNARTDTGETTAKGSKITVNALVEAAKQFGANVVARTPLRDLKAKAWQHTAAERRAGKAWQAATAAGKTAEAVKAKQDQVLNNAAAKAAIDARAEAAKIFEFFKRVTKGNDEKVVEKGRDPDIVNAARAVLAAYGVETSASKGAQAYLDALATNDPETFNVVSPMVAAATQNAQPLDALTFEELQALHEEIQAMWFLAKRSRQMEVDGDLMDVEDAAAEVYARLEEIGIPDTVPGETGALTKVEILARQWLQQIPALGRRVEQWAEGKDGKFGGPFLRLLFQPVKDAADRYRADRLVYRKKFQALVDAIAPSMRHETIAAPELNYTFGRGHNGIGTAELLHALAHTGNESNKRKLLLGRGWATDNGDGTLDTSRWDAFITRMANEGKLTPAHYDFVQGVWDLMEQTKPLAQKTHRDVFGRYFAEVTAEPFVDPWGQARSGGYAPAVADPLLVQDADLRELLETENAGMSQAFPATNKGFTKGRVEYNRPLKLDLRTLPQHIDKVLLFSHMEPAVRGASKLLRQKNVSRPLARVDPAAMGGMLKPWLNRSARQTVETPISADAGLNRMASTVRGRVGMALMFANVSNTLQQITGFLSAALKVKPSLMRRATAQYIASPSKFKESVWALSPYMADRASNEVAVLSDTLEAILINPSVYAKSEHFARRHGYFLQTALDNQMSPIIWTAAYNQGLAEGMDERMAIRFADGTIRQTQGSTLPEDISRIESGPAYARLFTQFIGYFNMLANTNATALQQIAAEQGLKKGAGKAFGVVLMGLLAPIWVAEAIAHAMRGGPDDEDDDGYLDDWLAAVFGFGTIRGMLAGVPFLGAAAQSAVNRFNDQPADDKFSLSPTVSVLESAVGAPASVYKAIVDDASAQKAVRDVSALITVATGMPAMAVARPVGYAVGVAQGKIEPTGRADLARGLVTGTASPESKQR